MIATSLFSKKHPYFKRAVKINPDSKPKEAGQSPSSYNQSSRSKQSRELNSKLNDSEGASSLGLPIKSLGQKQKAISDEDNLQNEKGDHALEVEEKETRFYDEQKVLSMLKKLQTLNQDDDDEGLEQRFPPTEAMRDLYGNGLYTSSRPNKESGSVMYRVEAQIRRNLFEINFILLSQRSVTVLLYHIVLFIEFLQQAFFIFAGLEVVNEFHAPQDSASGSMNSTSSDSLGILDQTNALFQSAAPSSNKLFISDYLKYFILHFNAGNNSPAFITVYAGFCLGFIALTLLLLMFHRSLYESVRTDLIKDGTRLLLQGLTLAMLLYLSVFQLPFATYLFEGYQCIDESTQSTDTLSCNDVRHSILFIVSSVFLVLYYSFIVIELRLVISKNLEGDLPWSGFDRYLFQFTMLVKLALAASFALTPSDTTLSIVHFCCGVVQAYILIHRCTDAVTFDEGIHWAQITQDTLLLSLFAALSLLRMTGSLLNVTTLLLIAAASVIMSSVLILWQRASKAKLLMQPEEKQISDRGEQTVEIYLTFLYLEILKAAKTNFIKIDGIYTNHLEVCQKKDCHALKMAKDMDGLKQWYKEKEAAKIALHAEKTQDMSQHSIIRSGRLGKMPQDISVDISLLKQASNKLSSRPQLRRHSKNGVMIEDSSPLTVDVPIQEDTPGDLESMQSMRFRKINEDDQLQNETIQAKKEQHQSKEFWIHEFDADYLKRKYFKFLSNQVINHIAKFPKSISLRLLSSYIQRNRTSNFFKSIFDLMHCELLNPNLQEKFVIFRGKLEIQRLIAIKLSREKQKAVCIDSEVLHQYEKLFQRYQFDELLATHYAIKFWRELLSKHVDSSLVQLRGSEINRHFSRIQLTAEKLKTLAPTDVKFLYRYGQFLINIMNNEYEGIDKFNEAQQNYSNRVLARKNNGSALAGEKELFGENSAAAIFLVESDSNALGKIIHANEEVEYQLGFIPNDIIGQNINIIMTDLIAANHHKYLTKYLNTGKQKIVERLQQLFPVTKQRYAKAMRALIKIHTQLNGRIIFIGMLQRLKECTLFEEPKQEFARLPQNVILTDQEGFIMNVSEGLYYELGLHSMLFNYQDSSVSTLINLEKICAGIKDEENEISIMTDGGCVLSFDTRRVLENADIEKLDKSEVNELRKFNCQRQAFIQMIKQDLGYDKNCLCIYRIILLGQNRFITNQDEDEGRDSDTQEEGPTCNEGIKRGYTRMTQGGTRIQATHQAHSQSSSSQNNGSVSSTMSDSLSSSNGMRNFKQGLQGRKVPKNQRILNRFIIFALLILISLTSLEYSLLDGGVDSLDGENHHNLMSEKRTLLTALVSSHLKSYFNLAQKVEFNGYEIEQLNRFDARHEYIGRILLFETTDLQEAHEFCTKQRKNDDSGTNILQSQFEYQPVSLFRIDQENVVSTYQLPFRVALFEWLNEIIQLTEDVPEEDLVLPGDLYSYEPRSNESIKFGETTQMQKLTYFLAQNGLRTLRKRTREATQFQQENSFTNLGQGPTLTILIVGLALCLISVCCMLYQMRKIEKIQSDTLSLFAFMKQEHISSAHDQCMDYLSLLTDSTFVRRILGEEKAVEMTMKEVTQGDPEGYKQIMRSQRNSILYGSGNLMQGNDEESKELAPQQKALANVLLRKYSSEMGVKNDNQKVVEKTFIQKKHGKLYEGIIKKTYQDMKAITEKMRKHQMRVQQKNQEKRIQLADQRGEQEISKQYENIKGTGKRSLKKKFGLKKAKKSQDKESSQANSERKDISAFNESREHLAQLNNSASIDGEPSQISERLNKKDARRLMKAQIKEVKGRHSIQQTAEQEQPQSYEDRKNQFEKTMKKSTIGRKLGAVAVCLIIFSYFLQAYLYQSYFEAQLQELIKVIPIFFNRARMLSLSYSLMRERIIFNNSLRTFEEMPGYGFNLDYYYLDEAMKNERTLAGMKLQSPQITQSLVSLLEQMDSPIFCSEVIGETKSQDVTSVSYIKTSQLSSKDFNSYQIEITTSVAACKAAYKGDISQLSHLYSQGVDLSAGDWEKRSPLQYAVRGGQFEAVKYLLTAGANPNIPDRWGSKPLDFSESREDISQLLRQYKATGGEIVEFLTEPVSFNLTTNDERLFYAALNNDLKTAEIMYLLGWHVNELDIDGRTPVHVAAAEGHAEMVKFLAANGADLTIFDYRGRCSMDEAEGNGFIPLHIWIDTVISDNLIKQSCDIFAQGLLKQGISSAIGTFQRKFSDIQILINVTNNYNDRLNILRGPQFKDAQNSTDPTLSNQYDMLQIFWNYSELYVDRIVSAIESTILNSFTDYGDSYHAQIMILFVCFLVFELVALFVFRDWMMQRMREDIFESRGILNLIPNHAIESNKQVVEEIVKKLKN